MKYIRLLYAKLKYFIFRLRNPKGKKIKINKNSIDMDFLKNMEWIEYGGSYFPYYITKINGQKYYVPYLTTDRDKEGNTILNKFLITRN